LPITIRIAYGFLDAIRFWFPILRKTPVRLALQSIRDARERHPTAKLSAVPYGFGAYAIGEILRDHPDTDWFFHIYTSLGIPDPERKADHFTRSPLQMLTGEEFVQSLRDRQESSALVYVHGFATKFDDALYRLAQIKFDTNYQGVPIAFCWPSDGDESFIAYNHDRECVAKSIHAFSDLLHLGQTCDHVSRIYIIAHSLGSQIVTSCIDGWS
jgi:pimeloyl-ACP methyl ester carboxylesterase